MVEELIKVTEENGKRLVSARELHEFLEVTERFQQWFDKRVVKYDFVENEDFTGVKIFTLVNNGAKQELQDYAITLSMAKELSMVQNNEKGKQARRYFIKCEEALKTLTQKEILVLKIYHGGQDAISASQELTAIEIEEATEKIKDGTNRLLSAQQVCEFLKISKLTTTLLNEWLCNEGYGEMKKFDGESKRVFQPNQKFIDLVAYKGYSLTGTTFKGDKIKVVYSTSMVDYIQDKHMKSLTEYVRMVTE